MVYIQSDKERKLPHHFDAACALYGALDSSKANLLSDTANTGPLPYYGLTIHRIWYDCVNPSGADVELYWTADTKQTIGFFSGTYEYDAATNWITIPNNAKGSANANGDIGITTRGMGANSSYTIILELRKENEYYQRGQLNDPASFNYGTSGPKP